MTSTNPIVANALRSHRNTATNAAITIRPSPSASVSTADHPLTEAELRRATEAHIDDVRRGMLYLANLIRERGHRHDWSKLRYFPSYYRQFAKTQETGVRDPGWYNRVHRRHERHHVEDPASREDINLIDILEHIVDGVMAGKGRSGEYKADTLMSGLLERAYANTQKLVSGAVRVERQ